MKTSITLEQYNEAFNKLQDAWMHGERYTEEENEIIDKAIRIVVGTNKSRAIKLEAMKDALKIINKK